MSQKKILSISLAFFFLSTLFLFGQNQRGLDPDEEKNWWVLAFVSLDQDEKIDFFVENHSDKKDFSYEVSVGKEIILKDTFTAKFKEKTIVRIPSIKQQPERVRIMVTDGTETKEIYR